jgi:hypothetical protein
MEVSMSEIQKTNQPTRKEGWAKPVDRLSVQALPQEAINLNVEGRHLTSPLKGFGQLWQKTYAISLDGVEVAPTELIRVWKERFPSFWPEGNRFYGTEKPIDAGDVAVLNLSGPAHTAISTGIMVIYADDESFSFMTPEGHMFCAMITFSAFEEEGVTTAQVQALVRASDPLYETAFRLGFGHKTEDKFWHDTLKNVAAYFGAKGGTVEQRTTLVDPKVQWSQAKNVWQNAAIRTALHTPVRWIRGLGGR